MSNNNRITDLVNATDTLTPLVNTIIIRSLFSPGGTLSNSDKTAIKHAIKARQIGYNQAKRVDRMSAYYDLTGQEAQANRARNILYKLIDQHNLNEIK